MILTRSGSVIALGVPAGTAAVGRSRTAPHTPRAAVIPGTVVTIDSGSRHAMALTSTGRLYGWGDNSAGQLGDATRTDRADPVRIKAVGAVTRFAAGGSHGVAVDRSGQVWGWGDNTYGQIGDGTTTTRQTPVKITSLTGARVRTVSAGEFHTIATLSRGPAVRLQVSPEKATVRPKQKQRYVVTGVDVFGAGVGDLSTQTELAVVGGACNGSQCWAATPGAHAVTATVGAIAGRAILTVRGPAPSPSSSASSPTPSSTSTSDPSPRPATTTTHAGSGGGGHGGANGPAADDPVYIRAGWLASTGAPAGILLAVALGIAALISGAVLLIRRSSNSDTSHSEGRS